MFKQRTERFKECDSKAFDALIRNLEPLSMTERAKVECWEARHADYTANGTVKFLEDWRPFQLADQWAGNTCYFKSSFTVPEHFGGKELWLVLNIDGEALLRCNGKPLHGFDINRNMAVVAVNAKPGEKLALEIEAAPNWQRDAHMVRQGRQVPSYFFHSAEIAVIDQAYQRFIYTMKALYKSWETTGDEEVRRWIDLAMESLRFTENPDKTRRQAKSLLEQVEKWMEQLPPKCPSVYAIGHSHLDIAYLWQVKESVRKCARTFSNMLDLLDRYPAFRFTQSQPLLYEYAKQYYPELFERIKEKVNSGQWEIIGGMYVEPDGNIPDGESFIRQFLYGQAFIKKEFGIDSSICFLPDTFGFHAAFPQIIKGCGCKYFYTYKLRTNKYNEFPYTAFDWEGIDGSKVLAVVDGFGTYAGEMRPEELCDGAENWCEKTGKNVPAPYLYGFGDGGGGVTEQMLHSARIYNRIPKMPAVVQETAHHYFDTLESNFPSRPKWYGELYLEFHQGVYTSQAKIKRCNRKCEVQLRDTEILGVLSGALGEAERNVLTDLWKLVLLNQFHDILPGSSQAETYRQSYVEYEKVLSESERLQKTFMQKMTVSDDETITVYNTLSQERRALIELTNIQGTVCERPGCPCSTVLTEEGLVFDAGILPAIGAKAFYIDKRTLPDQGTRQMIQIQNGYPVLENQYLRVTFGQEGITRLTYKPMNREVLIGTGYQLAVYPERFDYTEAWDFEAENLSRRQWIGCPDDITIEENHMLRGKVVLIWHYQQSVIRQTVIMKKDSARLDFLCDVDWHEDAKMLKAEWEVDIYADHAYYDIPYGSYSRSTRANTSWDFAKYEVGAQKWADLSENGFGVALLNDCKYGYGIRDNRMTLSLLKAPKYPDDQADMGKHLFTYSLYPHEGDFRVGKVPAEAYDLNIPPVVVSGKGKWEGSRIAVDRDNIIVSCIKLAEEAEGTLVVRMYECYGRTTKASVALNGITCKTAYESDMLERKQRKVTRTDIELELDFRPYEIKTILLEG